MPESIFALVMQPQQRPGRIIEAIVQCFLVSRKIWRGRTRISRIDAEVVRIVCHYAVSVMTVFVVQLLRRCDGDDCLGRRGIAHGELNGIESAPRFTEYADRPARPGLSG